MKAFFDTNVLLYAFANDEAKRERAQQTLAMGGVISVQVVNEFVSVLRKKQRHEWPRIEAALAVVENWFRTIPPLTLDTHHAALALARDHGLAFYDALIVAAAREAGCDALYSEDLQCDRRFGDLVVVNPFL
ncbi:MAG TPA: PIN domain-containing protein [Roseiarcus sp.]|nr:PIN domain-containing protein [Roseiarcus sp.]